MKIVLDDSVSAYFIQSIKPYIKLFLCNFTKFIGALLMTREDTLYISSSSFVEHKINLTIITELDLKYPIKKLQKNVHYKLGIT